uniref:Amino acid adenylation n=1 Tax=Meloidogyne hapla TaxID=6305 RepID=A0A1I8BR42_MELHA
LEAPEQAQHLQFPLQTLLIDLAKHAIPSLNKSQYMTNTTLFVNNF